MKYLYSAIIALLTIGNTYPAEQSELSGNMSSARTRRLSEPSKPSCPNCAASNNMLARLTIESIRLRRDRDTLLAQQQGHKAQTAETSAQTTPIENPIIEKKPKQNILQKYASHVVSFFVGTAVTAFSVYLWNKYNSLIK